VVDVTLRDRNTVMDVACFWHVTPRTVRQQIAIGKLRCVRVGGAIRIRREDIEAYEAAGWGDPEKPPNIGSGSTRTEHGTSSGPRPVELSAFQRGRQTSAKPVSG